MGQRPWVIALHLGQTGTRGGIALDCAVAHGIVEHPSQNAQRVAGGHGELKRALQVGLAWGGVQPRSCSTATRR